MSTRITAVFVRLLLCSGLLLGLVSIPTPVTPAYAATIVVTTDADSGPGSLRQALADAAEGDTITFSGDMTITLSSELVISKSLTIDGETHAVTVSGNHATRVFDVTATTGTVTFNHLTIADGYATTPSGWCLSGGVYCGGGIQISGDSSLTVNVINCLLSGNASSLGNGGGINSNSRLNVTNSTFSGNSAPLVGGGIFSNYFMNVTNSTFSGNAASSGGGIATSNTMTVTNSTFSGNWAQQNGGGIENWYVANVINSTISGNSAPAGGGGIHNNYGTTTVKNSIVANNSGDNCAGYSMSGGTNNLADDGTCGSGFTNSASILLGAFGNYGGSTATFPLLPGSSAIDAGDDSVCAAVPVNGQDQRGVARTQGARCDIGAFESRGFTLATTGGDNQSTPISTTFTLPLSVTLSETGGNVLSGASITFTAPNSGASLAAPITVVTTTNAGGNAARSATANVLAGYYTVIASASSTVSTTFALTNLKGTSMSSLTGGPDPSTFGQPVTFTATVTSTIGTPTGDVTFMIDAANSVQPLVNGVATYVTPTLAAGSHSVTAVYNGDANYNGSASNTYTNTVVKADTTTSVTSSPNPSTLGQAVTFTTTVTSSGGTPTGNVTLTLDADNIVQPLVNGVATYVTNTLAIGNPPITATYGGDANFLPSSQTLPGGQTVGAAYLDHLTLTVQPTSLYANGLDEARVTVTATTATGDGAPLAGRTISLTLDAGLGSLAHPIVTLDANGVATTTFTAAATPGLETLTATTIDHGLTKSATATLTLNPNPLTGKLTSEMGPVITYTFVITNASLAEQTVAVSGSLPLQTVLVSVTNGSAVATGGDYGWGYVQAEDLKLAAGQSYTLVWSVRPLTWLGDVINQAHAVSTQARLRLPVVNTIYRLFILMMLKNWP